jgi:hypothetical protein
MKHNPLAVRIAPSRIAINQTTYFADPPAGGDGGDPGGGGGDPGGGGGGEHASDDVLSFKPPEVDDVMKDIGGLGDPAVKKEEPAGGKKPEKKEPPVPAKKETAPDPADKTPAGLLRAELHATKSEREQLKTELEALKTQYAAGDPKVVEAQAELKKKDAEIAEVKKRADEYEMHAIISNPAFAPEIKAMNEGYDKDAVQFYRGVPEINQDRVNSLLGEYHKLPFGKENYADARAQWEEKVNESLGATDGNTHRKLDRVVEFIEKTHDFVKERGEKWTEVQKNYRGKAIESDKRLYSERAKHVDELLTKAREIPEGLEKADPLHPKVVLKAIDSVLKPEHVEQLDKGIDDYVRLVMTGVAPRTDADYTGMTADQITESQTREIKAYETARDHSADALRNGLRAMRRIPYLMAELQRLRAKVKEENGGEPPDPTKNGGGGGGGGNDDDLTNFKAPAVPEHFSAL